MDSDTKTILQSMARAMEKQATALQDIAESQKRIAEFYEKKQEAMQLLEADKKLVGEWVLSKVQGDSVKEQALKHAMIKRLLETAGKGQ